MTTYAPNKNSVQGKRVNLGNIDIHYEEFGAGKPLILLHGFGGCTQNWYPFVDALAQHYRLILVDLRGHGYSTNPDNLFTHKAAAQDIFQLLDHLEIHSFSAMGMSSGGMTLLHMTTSQPERIEAMVLISATTHFPAQARAIMRNASLATMPRAVQEMYRACATRGDEQIQQLIAQFNALADNNEDMNFTEQDLARIRARTLIVHGDDDRFFPVDIPQAMYRAIPNSELWLISGGDHAVIFDPAIGFAEKALGFLKGNSIA